MAPADGRPRVRLNRELILDNAQAIVRADGLDALTMATLAARLGADRTAVYRHFRSKDALLGALLDRVLDRVQAPSSALGAADQLVGLASALAAVLAEHQGAVALMAAAPFSRASATLVERGMAGLVRAGCDPGLAARAAQAMFTFVLGSALQGNPSRGGFWLGIRATGEPTPTLDAGAVVWDRAADAAFEDGMATLPAALLGE